MKTTFVSTVAVSAVARQSVMRTQGDLVDAQKEVSTGRLADIGRSLGSRTAQTVSLRQEHARLGTLMTTNEMAGSRLETTQLTLDQLRKSADGFLGSLIAAGDDKMAAETLKQQATGGLQGLIASLNASAGGQQLFGGINAGARPIADYFSTPPAANKQAVDNAFAAAFGMAQDDPAVATIDPAEMQSFLDSDFAALFDNAQWSANWSAASSENIQSRISSTEVVESSVNANEGAMRKLAMAYAMVADLGLDRLNEGARRAVAETATRLISEGIHEITALQGRVGGAQQRIAAMNERMSAQLDILGKEIGGLENVDPYEAASRVTTLMTQLETGYALTARIQRLSILNYL